MINLSQSAYIEKMLLRFGMNDCKPAPTPMVVESVAAETGLQDPQALNSLTENLLEV